MSWWPVIIVRPAKKKHRVCEGREPNKTLGVVAVAVERPAGVLL